MQMGDILSKYYKIILKKTTYEGLLLGFIAGTAHLVTLKLLNPKSIK